MKDELNDIKCKSGKIIPKVDNMAVDVKEKVGLTPNIIEANNKTKKQKLKKILKKESRAWGAASKLKKGVGIIWDNKAIDEQNNYRKKHILTNSQKHKMKSLSRTKYNSEAVIGIENDDEYLKNLIKVNQITVTDELIKNIIKQFNEPNDYNKIRTYSTKIKTPNIFDFHSQAIRNVAKNINVFDGVLDDESKITLQNTIINKFHKEVLG